jgi:hypothetical protein
VHRTTTQAVELPLKAAQTAAILEVVHSAVGLVRSPVFITGDVLGVLFFPTVQRGARQGAGGRRWAWTRVRACSCSVAVYGVQQVSADSTLSVAISTPTPPAMQ